MFELNMMYADPPTPENDKAWNDLLPVSQTNIQTRCND